VYRLATGWTVQESNPGGREFSCNRLDWTRGPISLLSLARGKAAKAWREHPPQSSVEVKERVVLNLPLYAVTAYGKKNNFTLCTWQSNPQTTRHFFALSSRRKINLSSAGFRSGPVRLHSMKTMLETDDSRQLILLRASTHTHTHIHARARARGYSGLSFVIRALWKHRKRKAV